MNRIIFVMILCTLQLFASDNYKKVKLPINDKNVLNILGEIGIDHFAKSPNGGVEFFVSADEYNKLLNYNLRPEILIDDWFDYYKQKHIADFNALQNQLNSTKQKYGVTGFDFGSMGGYYTLDEVNSKLDEMILKFPNLISQKDVIGYTHEDREILAVKISDSPNMDEDEPEVLYTALHHAREPESMMQMIYFMFYLLENYGSDNEVTYLVNNREMYFIPVVNPDGYEYNRITNPGGGGMWRKNRRNNLNNTFGVDLNRNYGPMKYWDSPNGGSDIYTSSDIYRGPLPFSEPETSAIKNFLIKHKISACLNYHSYGNLLIYPYGALPSETADSSIFREFANEMTQHNYYVHGTDQQTVNYSTRGNSDDFMYDGEPDSVGKIFAMTPEVGKGSDGFWPLQDRIIPIAEENLIPNLYYAWVTGGFIGVNRYRMDKEFIQPGDTINLSVTFLNKGLSELDNFNAAAWSESDKIIFKNERYNYSGLESRSEFDAEDQFTFILSPDAVLGSTIDVFITTSKDNTEMFTKQISFSVGKPVVYFDDNNESIDSNWTVSTNSVLNWEDTRTIFYSPPVSITDSKFGDYMPSSKVTMTLKNNVNLLGIAHPILSFKTKFEIERDWDFGQCLISADSGSTWHTVKGIYTSAAVGEFQPAGSYVYSGQFSDWVTEEIDLSEFSGSNILIKFELNADEYVEMDGWYIDDIKILYYDDKLSAINESQSIIDKYELQQNYPNPFNPSTVISYQIPANSDIEISIYNLAGELIEEFTFLGKTKGTHTVQWNGTNSTGVNVASGVYFCKMKAVSNTNGKHVSKISKMLLLR